jgi:threonyl-tRNA synthetase
VETTTSLTADGSLILYTWNDENGKKLLAFDFMSWRKSLNKILESNGPAISNGYDIDFEDQKITEADFKLRIAFLRFQEENMNLNYVLSKADIRTIQDNVYKTEMIKS